MKEVATLSVMIVTTFVVVAPIITTLAAIEAVRTRMGHYL